MRVVKLGDTVLRARSRFRTANTSMSVSVVNIRVLGVLVRQHIVPVWMRMRLRAIPSKVMSVLVMLIV